MQGPLWEGAWFPEPPKLGEENHFLSKNTLAEVPQGERTLSLQHNPDERMAFFEYWYF